MGRGRIGGGKSNKFSSARLSLRCVKSLPNAGALGSRDRYVWEVVIMESMLKLLVDGLGRDTQSKVCIQTSGA